ncbi:GreA/GreB family elongation factor [Candidatus Sulfidibacterium hydrothermale]|uniref:GreA/GreB family elongation factor n=1 Tax=Candidatus Sulfidibacterium hydrothermale TaxID=2875962 RepID=UPI001F0AD215|nr:GreA/GreB family elongation factor [Candidatus Sulfidibacterium hydrothermale]UBM62956.1 GreA/GreB family elongation factor [Candidatus Sulfidibacterium hydrothermale]
MDKLELKNKLLAVCIARQQATAAELQHEVDETLRLSNEYGAPKDRYDPYRTKLMNQNNLFAQQLKQANTRLVTLQKIPTDKEIDTVEFGAIVITDKQKLFISVGMGKVELDGTVFYAISPRVPIFEAMRGKKAGDSFTFNGQTFRIEDVF